MRDPNTALTNRVIVVTGATDGIGRATALGPANAGATVLVHGRDRAKGRAVVEEIERETDGAAELYLADLATQSRVRSLVTAIADRHDRIYALVNNAEASFHERRETADVIERTLAVNHLAAFLLTLRLLPRLRAAPHARVVTVSSEAHRRADPHDLLANALFAYELARRLDPVDVTSAVTRGSSRRRV